MCVGGCIPDSLERAEERALRVFGGRERKEKPMWPMPHIALPGEREGRERGKRVSSQIE